MKDVTLTISLNLKGFQAGVNTATETFKKFVEKTDKSININIDNADVSDKLDNLTAVVQSALSNLTSAVQTSAQSAVDQLGQVITQTAEKVNKSTGEMGNSTIKALGEIGLAIGGIKAMYSALSGVFSSMISASNEGEKAIGDLSSALKGINEDSQENIASYQALATEIQKTTIIDDEHTLSLVTMAVNMGIVHEKREEAVRGAIGLAKAFENAGLSQETAMKGIAMAYEGNFSMLQRYIPALKSAGSEAEKMAILQEAMANGFQMAKDETDTGAGALIQYQNLIGDLQEHIGDMVKTALIPLVKVLAQVASFLNENQLVFKILVGVIITFCTALAKKQILLIANNSLLALQTIKVTALAIAYKAKAIAMGAMALATKIATAAQWALNVAMSANPIGALVALIVAAIAVIVALTMGVIKLFKAFKKGKEESQEPVVDESQLNKELGTVKDHLKEREKAIRDSYNEQREEVRKAYKERKISELEFFSQMEAINKNELNEIYGLHKDNFEKEIALTEKKIKVGKATHEELKKQIADYADWTKKIYGEDSEEHIDSLQRKQDAEKDHIDKIKKMRDNLDSFRKSLRTQEEVLTDSYNEQLKQQKEFLANKLISDEEYWKNLRLIKEKYDSDLEKLELQRIKDDVALTERKIQLGLATNDELRSQMIEYENYVREHYQDDEDAFISMLEKKQSVHKKFTDDAKKEIDGYSKQWSDVVKDFQSKEIDLSQLKSEFASISETLQRLKVESADPIAIDVIINKMTNELHTMETKDNTDKENAKFEFENRQLSSTDPEQARMQNQLKALDDYYAKRREMLISAGVEETVIDEQIARERGNIEQAYQTARMETIAGATSKILGDLAKSGVLSFETSKALQIAQLLIETPASAFAAYRSLVGIPIVGPALATAAFATAIATGMAQIANIKKQKPPKAEFGGLTGLLRGRSHSQGGIIIEAEGDEYITNKKRVSELGKNFFDFINFAPLDQVKRAFSNISLPNLHIPTMPQYAYSTGGYVQATSPDFKGLESRFDTLIDQIVDGFDRLNSKDYNINIKSHMNGVKYIREHNRMQEEYNRRMS